MVNYTVITNLTQDGVRDSKQLIMSKLINLKSQSSQNKFTLG